MTKRYILLLLFIALSNVVAAQYTNINWQKSHGGSNSDQAYSVRQAPDGGFILAGPSLSRDGEVTGHHDSTNYDYWVVKLDDTGALQWEKSLGGSMDDIAHAVFPTADSGYLVAGGVESGDGDVTGCTPMEYDYWMVKLSSTGAIMWNTCFGGSNYNVAFSAQQTADGNYIIAGTTYSTDSPVTGNHGGADFWVVKLSNTGNMLWEKTYGGSSTDQAKSIVQTADGGYIVAGSSQSNDGQVTGNHGGTDYWVVKIDDTGALQWQKSLGGSGEDIGYAVQQTFDGGYIVTGNSNSTDAQVTGNHGGADYWVVKLDDTGAIVWENSYGGSNDDLANSIQQTIDTGYIVSGSASSPVSGNVTQSFGNDDYWVVKISRNGTLQWQKSLGGSGNDDAFGIQQTTDSGYVVAGGSNSTDSEVTGNHGDFDVWVVKLSKCYLDSPTLVRSGNTLSVGAYSTYQWNLNGTAIPGGTNNTFTIIDSGIYSVNVTDSGGCIGTSKALTAQREGVNQLYTNYNILVTPNPTTGIVNLTGVGPVNINVYNTVGQLQKTAENSETISIAEFPTGLYFLRLSNKSGELLYETKVLRQ